MTLLALTAGLHAGSPAVQPGMGDPLLGLTADEQTRFDLGRVAYTRLLDADDGLGPVFNATSCASCHNNPVGGAGRFVNFHFGIVDDRGVFDPMLDLGGTLLQQLSFGCDEVIPAEATDLHQRITPGALGFGLIEAIPDAAFLALETTPPSAEVSGRAQLIVPLETPGGPARVGRFGWKAQVPTIRSFSADAAVNEMGLTNALLPDETLPNGDASVLEWCDFAPDPEDNPDLGGGLPFVDRVTDFQRLLAAPPQTPRSGMSGESLFAAVGCTDCHVAGFVTSDDPSLEAALRNRSVRPYSDFLLHDMGALADFPQADASAAEFRTTPLWGLRTRTAMLHDGRARSADLAGLVTQAVAWHDTKGSEAQAAARAYFALTADERADVIAFLDSLGRREFDHDGDDDVDADDLGAFTDCYGGSGYTADDACARSDLDQDGDVDPADLAGFVLVYAGPQADCDGDGTGDLDEIAAGAADADFDLVPDACVIDGDVDGDGDVDFEDLLLVIAAWGPCPDPPATCPADLDASGTVDFTDLLLVLTHWS
ncbi:MAG: hypothetical protein HKN62_10580 [Phycisphaerales bacterium]|nr:hypothetical protein [Phycisphaerales bacterium]